MQVKVFEAEDMSRALRLVREQMGSKAIIISTRTVRKGKNGPLKNPLLEITAALDEDGSFEGPISRSRTRKGIKSVHIPDIYKEHSLEAPSAVSMKAGRETASGRDDTCRISSGCKESLHGHSCESIRSEMAELRHLIKDLKGRISREEHFPEESSQSGDADRQVPGNLNERLQDILIKRGIKRDAACSVAFRLEEEQPSLENMEEGDLERLMIPVFSKFFQISDPPAGSKGTRLALLGPTGVGKTTTIAKLAARFISQVSPHVALVTIDNYRIAAVEQLRIYAEIMNIPLEVVVNPWEMSGVLDDHQDKDLILIDTAGQNPRDAEGLLEMGNYLSSRWEIQKHLVLSSSTREEEMQKTIHSFEELGLDGLIFSKLDECEEFNQLFNVHFHSGYPLSYLTNGQNVPEDLMIADKVHLAQLIINGRKG